MPEAVCLLLVGRSARHLSNPRVRKEGCIYAAELSDNASFEIELSNNVISRNPSIAVSHHCSHTTHTHARTHTHTHMHARTHARTTPAVPFAPADAEQCGVKGNF